MRAVDNNRTARSLLFLSIACAFAGSSAGSVSAQAPAVKDTSIILTVRGDEPPAVLARTIETLEAGGRKVILRIASEGEKEPVGKVAEAPAAATPTPLPEPSAKQTASRIEAFWDSFVAGFDYGNDAIPAAADVPREFESVWAANRNGLTGMPASIRLVLGFTLAVAAAALGSCAIGRLFNRQFQPASSNFTARLVASGYGLLRDAAALAIAFGLLRLWRRLFLPEFDLASQTLDTLGNGLLIAAGYNVVGRFLLAPNHPERRLMPLPRADHHFRMLMAYTLIAMIAASSVLLSERAGVGRAPVAGLFTIAAFVVTGFKLFWFYDARHDLQGLILSNSEQPGPMLRLLALVAPWFYAAVAIVIWMVSRASVRMLEGVRWTEAAAITQIVVVLAPVIACGVRNYLACRRARQAETGAATPQSAAQARAGEAAATGLVWAVAFYLLARLWAGFAFDMDSPEFSALSRRAGGVAALLFVGWVAIVYLRSLFDAYAPRRIAIGPADEDAMPLEAQTASRLGTVLPVLRGVVLGAVAGLTGLVVLSRLGVDIGPLLAGFGILGLAISFGSQALVRDIVSGFFFMIEDAFRVGEYVDTGRLKGTVEKISLRSVQLRHQSGQVHTVPFGQIPSLTNASRDWATIKFNIRLDRSADIEKARKTIKKVGLALLEDPEYGPHFIAQLKMQGVADIDDTAVIIRLKFTAKPAHGSMLQRECLKRVYRALNEADVPFASNAVTVRGSEASARSGVAAALTSALPAPVPPLTS